MKNTNIFLSLFLFFAIFQNTGFAQNVNVPDPTLESPYNTIYVHLFYLQHDNYEPAKAAKTMPPGMDSIRAVNNAIKLKQILDGKGLYVRLNALPEDNAYRDTLTNKFIYTPFPIRMPDIYLERIDGKWYFSRETITMIPEMYKSVFPFGADILVDILPRKFHGELFGLETWQFVGIAIILGICALLYFLFLLGLKPVIDILTHRVLKRRFVDKETIFKLSRIVSLILIAWIVGLLLPAVQLPIQASEFTHKALSIIMTVFVILLGLQIIDVLTHKAKELADQTESRMDDQALPILNRILKIVLVALGIFHILNLLNVNIAALIAGISIGGLALALAAQDTVKNLIGSLMIFMDRPFQVGDYVSGNGFEGTIEEVGFRTTRIRTIGTSIISVPNGTLANMSVENYGMRVYRILNLTLGVTYDTHPDKMEAFTSALKQMIHDHEKIADQPYYVFFRDFADSSLNVMFRCYIEVASYADELVVREEILLKILRIAYGLGVRFAFPSTSLYVEQLNGQPIVPQQEGTAT